MEAPPASRSRTVPRRRCGSFCEPSIAICCVRCGSAGLRKRTISCAQYDAEVDARRRGERRRDLFRHLKLDEARENGIGRCLPDELVPREKPEIGERRMAAVQQAQLHRLERRDVGDELRPVVLPRGPRAGEAILDHPLPERLEHDRRGVRESGAARRFGDVGRRRRGHDAIDHRRGKRDVARDPVRQRGIGGVRERGHDPRDDASVVRKIVAADHRQRARRQLGAVRRAPPRGIRARSWPRRAARDRARFPDGEGRALRSPDRGSNPSPSPSA